MRRLLLPLRLRTRALAAGSRVSVRVERGAVLGRRVRWLVGWRSESELHVAPGARIRPLVSVLLRGGRIALARDAVAGTGALVEVRGGGSVELGPGATLAPGCVLRAEAAPIRVGAGAVLEELAVIRSSPGRPVTVGAGAIVGAKVTVLPGAVIADGGRIGPHTVVGADGPRRPRRARANQRRTTRA